MLKTGRAYIKESLDCLSPLDDGDPHYLPAHELAERIECHAAPKHIVAGRLTFTDWLWIGVIVGVTLIVLKTF